LQGIAKFHHPGQAQSLCIEAMSWGVATVLRVALQLSPVLGSRRSCGGKKQANPKGGGAQYGHESHTARLPLGLLGAAGLSEVQASLRCKGAADAAE
jgi:hypothetical protein